MSVQMPDADDSTDYSDFEYQQGQISLRQTPADAEQGARTKASFSIEPLAPQGGLDNNEVVELVYFDMQLDIEYDDETADQGVSTYTETRAIFGANFPSDTSQLELEPTRDEVDGTVSIFDTNGFPENEVSASHRSRSDDRIFQTMRATGNPPFDDTTSGPGGGSTTTHDRVSKNWRDLVGRGPVLDSSDDLSWAVAVITGDLLIECTAVIRYHMVFDVAEVSDAGRAFSVPMDD